jgi:hypothetical protein
MIFYFLFNAYWDSDLKNIRWLYSPIPIFQKVTAGVTATAVSLR